MKRLIGGLKRSGRRKVGERAKITLALCIYVAITSNKIQKQAIKLFERTLS